MPKVFAKGRTLLDETGKGWKRRGGTLLDFICNNWKWFSIIGFYFLYFVGKTTHRWPSVPKTRTRTHGETHIEESTKGGGRGRRPRPLWRRPEATSSVWALEHGYVLGSDFYEILYSLFRV